MVDRTDRGSLYLPSSPSSAASALYRLKSRIAATKSSIDVGEGYLGKIAIAAANKSFNCYDIIVLL